MQGIITRWIACRLANHADTGAKEHGYQIFQALSQQSSLRSSAGWFFEAYTHDWLRKGGTFEADRLSHKDSLQVLTFDLNPENSREARYFTTPGHLANQLKNRCGQGVDPWMIGIYFQPRCRTQESFDSLMVTSIESRDTLVLFQITMATTHAVKTGGVREILQALPKTIQQVFIIFVVPEDRVDNYHLPQKAPAADELTNGRYEYKIKQFRLVFPDDDLLSIAVPKPRIL